MLIKDIKVHMIEAPLDQPFQFSQGYVYKRDSVIVEVITDDGITGWGESLCHGVFEPHMAATFIEKFYKPRIIGKSILDAEVIWETCYNDARPIGQQGVCVNALSGLDIAIWDCLGKTFGQPVYNLMGGKYRDKVPAYATGFFRVKDGKYPEDAIEEAHRHMAKGFKAMKLKNGFGVEEDIKYIRALREAVGFDVKLMADFNCAYNVANARRLLYELEDCKLEFMEELLLPEDVEGYATLRHLTSNHLAAGECCFAKRNFARWFETGALDIYQPDLCSAGGFTECRKIAVLAQIYNTALIPHIWGSGVALAASLQFLATLSPKPICAVPVEPMVEYDQSSHPFRLDLIGGSVPKFEDGCLFIPDAPGIGVEVDRKVLERFEIK